jgi:mediator of RNA polymerase II transcription subunit 19
VARFDPQTNQKRKLRKSYKNQISDLPGKHVIPPGNPNNSESLLQLARQPPRIDPNRPPPPLQPPLDQDLLSRALSLDRTPATGIPDFDVSLLATPSYPMASSPTSTTAPSNGLEKKKKRKEEYTDSLNPKRFKK